jgi:hypothetical protein
MEQAAADLVTIMSDTVGGFAIPITVIDPDDNQATINGFANDIGQELDPETGTMIVGRQASVALPIRALRAADLGEPRAIADDSRRPWRVQVQLPTATTPLTFKVTKTMPDKLGCIVCFLQSYR